MLLNCYKIQVVHPPAKTKVRDPKIKSMGYLTLRLIPEDDPLGKYFTIVVFEKGENSETYHEIAEKAKKWRKFPHTLIGKRTVGQIHKVQVPTYHVKAEEKPVYAVRRSDLPRKDWKKVPLLCNSITFFVHKDEDKNERTIKELKKHYEEYPASAP
jgi:hypothetical protein